MFQVAIFLGAFLLFLIQPLVAKRILPWFGGGPAVWSMALLFFQVALVGGYAYAHATRRLGGRRQVWTHLALLAAALATLSILPSDAWKPAGADSPASRVLTLLATHVGFPFVLLAATAPLLQDWHARLFPDRSPYRLYALSNAGSLLALASYPFVVEPWLGLRAQAAIWSVGFALFAAACAWCGWRARHAPMLAPAPETPGARAPGAADQLLWMALPACGAALLVATSAHLTQNVAPVPLLWVAPLAIYLATYIVAFADGYRRRLWLILWVPALVAAVFVMRGAWFGSLVMHASVYLGALFVGCLVCHGEVARLRPHARHLTDYYLALAIGGGLGGAFVAVVAPLLFTSYLEFPLLYVGVTAVAAWAAADAFAGARQARGRAIARAALAAGVIAAAIAVLDRGEDPLRTVESTRNFYGIVSVVDDRPGARAPVRRLYHGQILHGVQFVDPVRSRQPTSYYVENTGIDLAVRHHAGRDRGEPITIGVVGLGAGTMAALGRPGDRIRFYELDPEVIRIAGTYFTYLRDSPATVDVIAGDGRLSIEREARELAGRGAYDVLALDAFSGDAVPVHLLTREAFELYRQVLGPDGIIAVNISNRYLDLRPVVRAQAAAIGMQMRHVQLRASGGPGSTASSWLIVTASPAWLARYPSRSDDTAQVPWTDAFSSLLSVLRP